MFYDSAITIKYILLTYYLPIVILWIIVFIVNFNNKKREKFEYYREVPKNLPPAILMYYYNDGSFDNNSMWITFFDFVKRGYYKLMQDGKKVFITTKLKLDEEVDELLLSRRTHLQKIFFLMEDVKC